MISFLTVGLLVLGQQACCSKLRRSFKYIKPTVLVYDSMVSLHTLCHLASPMNLLAFLTAYSNLCCVFWRIVQTTPCIDESSHHHVVILCCDFWGKLQTSHMHTQLWSGKKATSTQKLMLTQNCTHSFRCSVLGFVTFTTPHDPYHVHDCHGLPIPKPILRARLHVVASTSVRYKYRDRYQLSPGVSIEINEF